MADDKRYPRPVSFEYEAPTDPDIDEDQVPTDPNLAATREQKPRSPLPPEAALELSHLLVRVAWIDLELSPEEWVAVLHIAASLGLNTEELKQISGELAGELPVPTPNLKLLAQYKSEVLTAAQRVINADKVLNPVEAEFFRNLTATLNRQD